jgi:hypothetical protein
VCVLALAGPAQAIHYDFPIDGAQVPFATPGTGTGIVDLIDQSAAPDDWLLSWNITYSGLLGSPTAAHFHGPAPAGSPAGIRLGFASPVSPIIGNQVISDAFATEIVNGLWYVNIHSTVASGGEIRGQVVPEPASVALVGFGAAALLGRRRRHRRRL